MRSTATILRPPEQHWQCPSCGRQEVTRQAQPHTRMHPCPSMKGFLAPMVSADQIGHVTHRTHVREDYVAGEDVRLDGDGVPIMAVDVERADGSNDRYVYAPTAHLSTTAPR